MNKEKKPNWLVVGGVGITLLLIILAALASPLLIYVALVFLGFIAVANMIRIDRLTQKEEKEPKEEPEEEVVEPEADVPPEPPYQKRILKKARRFLTDGYTIEEIREALSEKYTDSVVDLVIKELEE